MELTRLQRAVTFAAIVLALAGLGAYLFLPAAAGARRPGGSSPGSGGHRNLSRAVPSASPGTTARPGPAGSPAAGQGGPPLAGSGQVPGIWSWLPFTQAGLAAAARVAEEFTAFYGTYSYAEPASAYVARIRPLATASLAALVGRAYATPGLEAARSAGRQVSTATAVITSLRGFGPSSITFVVALTQRISGARGAGTQVSDYAVTVTGSGTRWQVSDIELAGAGNQ